MRVSGLLVLALVLAGCSGPQPDEGRDEAPRCSGCEPPLDPAPIALNCEGFLVAPEYTKDSVAAHMPDGLEPIWSNAPTSYLMPNARVDVRSLMCDVELAGNESLSGARIVIVSVWAKPTNHTGIAPSDHFVFDLLTDAPRLQEVLVTHGVPARLAEITYEVTSDGMRSSATEEGTLLFEASMRGDQSTTSVTGTSQGSYILADEEGRQMRFWDQGISRSTQWSWVGSVTAASGPLAAFTPGPNNSGLAIFVRTERDWTFDGPAEGP